MLGVAICHAQPTPWSPEDVVKQEQVSEVVFSPDGQKVAWVKRRPDTKKDAFVSDLWITYLDKKDSNGQARQVQLTRSADSDRNPVFSADGETLYFLSSRSKGKALWAMSLLGGAPYAVDSFEVSLSSLKTLNDSTLVFVASEGETGYEQELKKKKDNVVVVEDTAHFKANRIFSFDLKTKKRKRLTDNRYPIGEYAISKNGKWMVTQHIRSPHYGADGKPKPTYYLWNLENGSKEQILTSGWQTPGDFAFTQDNEGFYFTTEKSSDPEWQGAGISLLYYMDISTQTPTQVPIDWEWGLTGGGLVQGNDMWVTLANGPLYELVYLKKRGNSWDKREVEAGEMNDHIRVIARPKMGNQLAINYSTASTPNQWKVVEASFQNDGVELKTSVPFAQTNPHLKKRKLARSEIIRWKGALDDEITGILYYPTDYQEGRAYPLMLSIHGGPASVDIDRWQDRWSTYPHLLAEKGMFVFKPNYHGSSNHGLEFVESIKKHYYELELPDIMAGVDKLVEEGKVDADSLGVMGWSNGAILATMLSVQHPDKFKVVCAGAGDVNWTSDFGTCRFGVTFDQSYFGGAPWDNVGGKVYNEAYVLKSPLFEMEKVKAPTIIFHGSEDRAVPRDQGWEYYRSLQQIGQTPVRFLWFPGQRHGLAKLTHQTRKMAEEIAWIDTYLFGKDTKKSEVLKKGSPLLAMKEKGKLSQYNGQWGVRKGKYLIPQVQPVKADSISIGCYEVTQAQYAAFDRGYSYVLTEANHPVIGISYEQAVAYTQWLSKISGETYRLPNAKEAKALHKKAQQAGAKENTLRYWAGYVPTLDEVPALQAELTKLNRTLTHTVGHFAPVKVGKAAVYDLGGNVSEYFEDGGKAGSYGYSAWDFVDKAGEKPAWNQDHTGFRVVKE